LPTRSADDDEEKTMDEARFLPALLCAISQMCVNEKVKRVYFDTLRGLAAIASQEARATGHGL
jgi:hypothetical protein